MDFWRMPLDAGEQRRITGRVNVIAYRCKGCGYCIEFCPSGVLAESPEFNEKGYHAPYVKDPTRCKSCSYCETVCPEFAIFVNEEAVQGLAAADVLPGGGVSPRRRRRRLER